MKLCGQRPLLLAAAWVLTSVGPAASIGLGLGASAEVPSQRRHSTILLDPDKVRDGEEEPRHRALRKSEDAIKKIGDMRRVVPDMVKADAQEMRNSFLPDYTVDWVQFGITCCATLISVIWFVVYFNRFYKNDRDPINERWDAEGCAEREVTASVIQSDLVIVFSHPGNEGAEKTLDVPITSAQLKSALVLNESSGGVLPRTEELATAIVARESREASLSVMERAGHARHTLAHMVASDSLEENCQRPTKALASRQLLLDLYEAVRSMGFDIALFSSVDNDEIFMCVSLKSPAVGSSYLLRDNAKLQIKKSVVAALGIRQPPDEVASTPPYVRYDPRIPEKLHVAGVLDSPDPRRFYKTFHGRDKEGTIISGSDRIRIIFRAISQHVDLDVALQEGLLTAWYPAHNPNWLANFWSCWGHWSHLKDFTFVQPLQKMTEYFGSRVTFIFGWNGFYCKALLPLAILSILAELVALGCKLGLGIDSAYVNRKLIFSFGIVIIIWSRIASNLWDREQTILMKLWDLNPDSQEFSVRPSFQGELMPSPANLNVLEEQYPASQSATRRVISELVTLVFCGIVFLWVVAWTNMFEGRMDIYSSVCLSIQIVIFGVGWNELTPILTDWENHKYQSTYYDSYLWKQCLFQTVNSYTAFFYLAVKQRYTTVGCPPGGCMMVLRSQLIMTLVVLAVSAIAIIAIAGLLVKFKLWQEDRALRMSPRTDEEGSEQSQRFFTEEQAKLADFRLREQVQAMVQLVISLGFVLFFGAVAPVTVPLCLLVFMVQLRAQAFMLITYTKRPVPRKQLGIGRWRDVVHIFMNGNVIFTAILIINYSVALRVASIITKMSVVGLFYLGSRLIWVVVDFAFPAHNAEIEVLSARRKCTLNAVARRCEKVKADMMAGTSPRSAGKRGSDEMSKAMAQGNWAAIPTLAELSRAA